MYHSETKTLFNTFFLKGFGMIFLLSLLFCGCGKKEAPPPPRVKSQLVLELFNALDNNDYQAALNKTIRLKEIDQGDLFLSKLENIEEINLVISKVQKHVDNDNLDKAINEIDTAIPRLGHQTILEETRKELITLKKITILLKMINNPETSLQLAKNALKLKKITETYKPAGIFTPLIDEKIELAREMNRWENDRAIFGVCSDINNLMINEETGILVLLAELSVEEPDHPLVKSYLSFLNDSSDTINLPFQN